MASRVEIDRPLLGTSAEWIAGSWVGTFDSLKILDQSIGAPIKILGSDFSPGAVMLCTRFNKDHSIVGEARRNLSDNELSVAPIEGSFTVSFNERMQWIEGEILIVRGATSNVIRYVRSSPDELQILLANARSASGNKPGNQGQGVLHRVAQVKVSSNQPIAHL